MEFLSRTVASRAPESEPDDSYRYEIIDETLTDEFKKHFKALSFADGLAKFQVNGGSCVLTPLFAKNNADKVLNYQVRPDDVWIVTFPKCGNAFYYLLI